MQNWTQNELTVEGETKEVRRFLNHMGEGFSFEKIIPPPADMFQGNLGEKERRECAAKGIPNWHEWQSENWDTKWDACRVEVEEEECASCVMLTYRFDTAWSPPEKVIARLRQDWPEFEITGGYVGEGYEFCGPF